jgi:hypothetical protein
MAACCPPRYPLFAFQPNGPATLSAGAKQPEMSLEAWWEEPIEAEPVTASHSAVTPSSSAYVDALLSGKASFLDDPFTSGVPPSARSRVGFHDDDFEM